MSRSCSLAARRHVEPAQRRILAEMARDGHRRGWWAVSGETHTRRRPEGGPNRQPLRVGGMERSRAGVAPAILYASGHGVAAGRLALGLGSLPGQAAGPAPGSKAIREVPDDHRTASAQAPGYRQPRPGRHPQVIAVLKHDGLRPAASLRRVTVTALRFACVRRRPACSPAAPRAAAVATARPAQRLAIRRRVRVRVASGRSRRSMRRSRQRGAR